jgi:hypothetical protein
MASVIKSGKLYKVVNSRNKVPVGRPNIFKTRTQAQKRAREVKC